METHEPTQLSDIDKLEYEQLSLWARADDTVIYQSASTILPLSFGALAAAVQFPKVALLLAVFSIVLYVYWLLIATRLSWFSTVRLNRLRHLEAKLGHVHHVALVKPPADAASHIGARISIRVLRWIGAGVLLVSWFAVLWYLGEAKQSVSSVPGAAASASAPSSGVR